MKSVSIPIKTGTWTAYHASILVAVGRLVKGKAGYRYITLSTLSTLTGISRTTCGKIRNQLLVMGILRRGARPSYYRITRRVR